MVDATLTERFLTKIKFDDDDKCWPWIGAKLPYGPSGVIMYKGKMLYAHRLAYKILGRKRLSTHRSQNVLHTCGNKLCCNPKHLFIGSLSDAHALIGISKKHKDMRRGRHFLTTKQRKRIRDRALSGDTAAAIQRDYPSVHYATVLRHVKDVLSIKNNG